MHYEIQDDIAIITMDDGKANAVGLAFIEEMLAALERAESEAKAVVMRGREGMFSAGFNLKEFQKGPEVTTAIVSNGFDLLIRMYGYPLPLVVECTGHAIGMGSFMLMCGDYRLAAVGDYRHNLPESAIGMTIPAPMLTIALARLSPRHIGRAAANAEIYSPAAAVDAGFVDVALDPSELHQQALAKAQALAQLPPQNFRENKLAVRAVALQRLRDSAQQMRAAN